MISKTLQAIPSGTMFLPTTDTLTFLVHEKR
jgi:hypothetical protein